MSEPAEHQVDVATLDVGQAALFLGWAMADAVLEGLGRRGFDDVRFGHGVVLQRLLTGRPPTPSEIAEAIRVSAPSVSRSLRELAAGGYVERRRDPDDGRVRRVHLTARGHELVEAAREVRADLDHQLAGRIGAASVETLRTGLHAAIRAMGADEAIAHRRVRAPTT